MKQVRPRLALAVLLLIALSTGAYGQSQCGLTALTETVGAGFDIPGVAGDLVVFDTDADLVGQNADGNYEIYAADLSTSPPAITQITHSSGSGTFSDSPITDGRRIAFESNADLVGENAGGSYQVFVYDLETSSLTQLSHGAADSFSPVIDGDLVAWISHGDPLGQNADGTSEVFVYDLATSHLTQVTHTTTGAAGGAAIDAGRVAFVSSGDVLGPGTGGSYHLYLYDTAKASLSELAPSVGGTQSPSIEGHRVAFKAGPPSDFEIYVYDLADQSLKQITNTPGLNESNPSIQGDFVAFASQGDPLGTNPDHDWEIFLYDLATSSVVQVTDTTGGTDQAFAVLSGSRIVFLSNADPTGTNSDGGPDLFVADCPDLITPPPPAGPWLTSAAISDFQFKVRIAGPNGTFRQGVKEPGCISETLCVSGAVPGRSEVFLRIVGPKPNGKLWPTLVKFSTSQVEIWVEQLSSGDLRYYRLAGASPGVDTLPGLFDRNGFTPASPIVSPPAFARVSAPTELVAVGKANGYFTSPQFPGFRFRVTIDNGGTSSSPATVESQCIDETICLSGAVPGRSELFVRIVGPKPNGYLWPTLVKFSTSPIDVWIEQTATGVQRHYHLDGATPGSDDLTGIFDRMGFQP